MTIRTVTLSVTSPTEGSGWNASFSVDDATQIKNIINFAITCNTNTSGNFSVPNTANITQVVNGYSSIETDPASSSDDTYITWRSVLISGQYPSSGKSMDIWSHTFYNDIKYSSKTWSQMSASYELNPRKWSLFYDYSARYAPVLSKGGTLTVSLV